MKKMRYCEFDPHLYLGARVRDAETIKRKLTRGAGQLTVYLIAVAPGMPERLAILHAANLKQKYYEDHPLHVYGIAEGYEEARDLIVQISDEAIRNGYAGEIKAYLDARETGDGA